MSWPRLQAIDCDIHPSVPSMRALLPYLDDHWRETVEARGIASLESISYPRHAPLTARLDSECRQTPHPHLSIQN